MQVRSLLALATALSLAPSPARAASALAFVRATSQLSPAADAKRYAPLNLLDHDAKTLWCEGALGDGRGQEVRLSFKAAQVVDHVRLKAATGGGRPITAVRIGDGQRSVQVSVGDGEAVAITPALQGTEFVVVVEGVGPAGAGGGALGADDACLADLDLLQGSRPLTAAEPAVGATQLVGRWSAEPLGAPEKFLSFNLDGTWQWSFEPLLGGAGKQLSGTYKMEGGRLRMRRGAHGKFVAVPLKIVRVAVDTEEMGAAAGDYDRFEFGAALGADLAGAYNNARF